MINLFQSSSILHRGSLLLAGLFLFCFAATPAYSAGTQASTSAYATIQPNSAGDAYVFTISYVAGEDGQIASTQFFEGTPFGLSAASPDNVNNIGFGSNWSQLSLDGNNFMQQVLYRSTISTSTVIFGHTQNVNPLPNTNLIVNWVDPMNSVTTALGYQAPTVATPQWNDLGNFTPTAGGDLVYASGLQGVTGIYSSNPTGAGATVGTGVGIQTDDDGTSTQDDIGFMVSGYNDALQTVRNNPIPKAGYVRVVVPYPSQVETATVALTVAGTKQIETLTLVGDVGAVGAGTLNITVTAVGMTNSGKTIPVNVTNSMTTANQAIAVAGALNVDVDVAKFFTVTASASNVVLTAINPAGPDGTMNVASALGTCTGPTPVPTSTNGTAGVLPGTGAGSVRVVIAGALFPGNLTVDTPIAAGDSANTVASKIAAKFLTLTAITDYYAPSALGATVVLTKTAAPKYANDATLNMAISGTSVGITLATTSVNTSAGTNAFTDRFIVGTYINNPAIELIVTTDPNYVPKIAVSGDFNSNLAVDAADLTVAATGYGGAGVTGKWYRNGDTNSDNDVDNADLGLVIGAFTPSVSSGSSNLVYDPITGNVKLDATTAAGAKITSFQLETTAATIVTGSYSPVTGGTFNGSYKNVTTTVIGDTDTTLAGATGLIDLGNVFPTGMTLPQLKAYLKTAVYTGIAGSGQHDLIPSPTLVSIVDNQSGGPINANTLVTYTVTFSEDMDASSVSAADFGNAGIATVTIGSVTETSPTSGVFIVQATPTSGGTLRLKVNAEAVLNNVDGIALNTTAAIPDDTTITVIGPVHHFAISAIGSPKTVGTPITGITVTAQDVNNLTATSFTGTVTFGGTAGVTGTSASFVAGVLSSFSFTPTVSGSNLTLTVDDGAAHTGSATIATVIGPVHYFAISAIGSPKTVGTLITGISIIARDVNNFTATSFTGTVTFGGTAGVTGTSASFVAGVLSGVSVTPTVAGSNLTFTVDDGAAHTGSTTITTVQTQFTAWSGGTLSGADTNSDGVKDGVAWVLGAANPSANATGLLPTSDSSDATYFIYTYRRTDAANSAANTTILVQYGSDLSGWTPAVHDIVGTDIIIAPTNDFYGAGIDKVQVKIKKTLASGGKIFARLSVTTSP